MKAVRPRDWLSGSSRCGDGNDCGRGDQGTAGGFWLGVKAVKGRLPLFSAMNAHNNGHAMSRTQGRRSNREGVRRLCSECGLRESRSTWDGAPGRIKAARSQEEPTAALAYDDNSRWDRSSTTRLALPLTAWSRDEQCARAYEHGSAVIREPASCAALRRPSCACLLSWSLAGHVSSTTTLNRYPASMRGPQHAD